MINTYLNGEAKNAENPVATSGYVGVGAIIFQTTDTAGNTGQVVTASDTGFSADTAVLIDSIAVAAAGVAKMVEVDVQKSAGYVKGTFASGSGNSISLFQKRTS